MQSAKSMEKTPKPYDRPECMLRFPLKGFLLWPLGVDVVQISSNLKVKKQGLKFYFFLKKVVFYFVTIIF